MHIIVHENGDIYLDVMTSDKLILHTDLLNIIKADITPDGKYLIAMTAFEYQIFDLESKIMLCRYTGRYYGFVLSFNKSSGASYATYWMYIQSDNGILETRANEWIIARPTLKTTYYSNESHSIRLNNIMIANRHIAYTVGDTLYVFSDVTNNKCEINVQDILKSVVRTIYLMNDGRTLVVLSFNKMLVFDVEYGLRYGEYGRRYDEEHLPKYRYWVIECKIDISFACQLNLTVDNELYNDLHLLVGMGERYSIFKYDYRRIERSGFISKLFKRNSPLKLMRSSGLADSDIISLSHTQPLLPNITKTGIFIRTRQNNITKSLHFYTHGDKIGYIMSINLESYEYARYIAEIKLLDGVVIESLPIFRINTVDATISPSIAIWASESMNRTEVKSNIELVVEEKSSSIVDNIEIDNILDMF